MIFKSLPFDKSSRRNEYFDFLSQPFHVGMIGFVGGIPYDNQQRYFYDWHGTQMLNWVKFSKDKYSLEFYKHKNFYIVNNPTTSQKNYTFPHPRTLMDLLSDLDRCGVECEWSEYIIHNNDVKHILSNCDYKTYIDDLLNRIGKGMDSSK